MRRNALLALALLCFLAGSVHAQFDDVEIRTTQLTDRLHMLEGSGGNLVVCTGDDGIFLIDDQYAPLTGKILAAIGQIREGQVDFVINTHWHGDHVGGNENLGETGAVVVAHENVRERMSVEQFSEILDRKTEASPRGALPVVTFREGVTFHLNGLTIEVRHVANAHTDGDAIVIFQEADLIHVGDVVFWGLYPFIDVDSGGSVDGTIQACDALLAMSSEETRFVPGHGPVLGRAEVAAYRDMLVDVRDRVQALIDAGEDLEGVQAAKPTAAYDADWGQVWLDGDAFARVLYLDLAD